MSSYLGFTPSEKPNYYFVSYNSEDAARIGEIAQFLAHSNLPIWYDHGLEYGEKWEENISGKIKNSQAILLFFTKGILAKENSYVRKEYLMATQYFDKKVYVIMVDEIERKDIPDSKIPWWIDIQDKQSLSIVGIKDPAEAASFILSELGMKSHEDKMNKLIANYKALYDNGQQEEAEAFLLEYLHGISLKSKAELLADLLNNEMESWMYTPTVTPRDYDPEKPLLNHLGEDCKYFHECYSMTVGDCEFTVGNVFAFRRGNRGDAHLLHIWRNGERIFTCSGLIEAHKITVHFDKSDDIIYIGYRSVEEKQAENELEEIVHQNILTVENPCGDLLCNDFRFLK